MAALSDEQPRARAARGTFDVKALVTHRLPLGGGNEGFAALDAGRPGLVRGIAVP